MKIRAQLLRWRSEERRVGKGWKEEERTAEGEDGIRDGHVTGVQTCALPISVKSAGLVLEDLDVRGSKNAIVRVIVDLPEDTTDNIGFDQVDAVTATISEALDENPRATAALAKYTLEVMSPGAERKLTQPRHWKRSIGRLVAVVLDSGKNLEGRVLSASDTGAELDAKRGGRQTLEYAEISHAKVRLEFNKAKKADASAQRGQESK